MAVCLVVVLVGGGFSAARAQRTTASISGQFVEPATGTPIAGALASLIGTDRVATSDSAGRFRFEALAAGLYVVQVRAIGYRTAVWQLQLDQGEALSRDFEVTPVTYTLAPIDVEGRRRALGRRFEEFQQRRTRGMGTFFTRDEIQRRNPSNIMDLLRTVRGVQTECSGSSCIIRMSGAPRSCEPMYFLDGLKSDSYIAESLEPRDIEGIELYRGAAELPAEFGGVNSGCGVVAIWTRSAP